jgi:SAM-dependent methyltransferase
MGVDSSRGMLEVFKSKIAAQHLTNVKARHVDLAHGGVLKGTYHLAVSSMTFHHIPEIAPVLAQLHAVLVPRGWLCVADLDPDGGQFHGTREGVFHPGFDRAALRRSFMEAGFYDIRERTAASIARPGAGGGTRTFTVFLMAGRKRA